MFTIERVPEFFVALFGYWWVIIPGGLFAVEPMIEPLFGKRVGRYRDSIPHNARTTFFRWTAVAALLLASFLAWNDQHQIADIEHDKRVTAEGERNEARRQLAKKSDRSKYVEALQKFYTDGSRMERLLERTDITDEQVTMTCNDVDKWYDSVSSWLLGNMSEAAVSRFLDSSDSLSVMPNFSPGISAETRSRVNNTVNKIVPALKSINLLMNSSQWDPQ
jgi:hypothetical protein